ncbi:MAG: DUF87 domain-containing protein [Deltaproteobacteria bacterium]|nr:DUF87 domain-containing protein [Deltaproteobacteria bacterium]
MKDIYEKLGVFYLGKAYDLASRNIKEELILYDSKDLSTHAVIIGMTGSGKTGLGIGLLEEALIDNIPVIAIDPKGDLPNLLLNFPDLKPEDFLPWVNPQDAMNKGLTLEEFAASQAKIWRKGLADWGQSPERIARLKDAADFAVYTPGSNTGLQVSVLRSFAPPPSAISGDSDLLRQQIQITATSLLVLLGIEADPITSREHILIANILEVFWADGKTLDLAGLIHAVQTPPFERVGVMDLESFYPPKDRFALATRLNALLAAPGFESWMEGVPLNIGEMLYTKQGKPRASIFTISHLSDHERMFFVTMLLNEMVGWMRTQTGTSSLRAVLYMDEIFGYFPPTSNPPSKGPLLTLLKQARASGLGVVLSTQNPVDLDYKGLANAGTWFLGRLQTERDKERVLAGLEGAVTGNGFDRSRMKKILADLGKQVFLLHNVHENEPVIFQTRWVLSYLRGPMTREQIKTVMSDRKNVKTDAVKASALPQETSLPKIVTTAHAAKGPPVLPPGISLFYLAPSGAGHGVVYYPGVAALLDVHYSNSRYNVVTTKTLALTSRLTDGPNPLDWDCAVEFDPLSLKAEPVPGGTYADLPADAQKAANHKKWQRDLLRWVCHHRPILLLSHEKSGMNSLLGEAENEFRLRLAQALREKRDLEVEKLRNKYSRQFNILKDRLMRADQALAREDEQAKARKLQTAISFGSAILGAFLGRKAVSVQSASRVGTAMRSASRIQKEKMDVARAQERAEAIRLQLTQLEERLQADIDGIDLSINAEVEELEKINIKPKSADIIIEVFGLAWMPFRKNAGGGLSPDWI